MTTSRLRAAEAATRRLFSTQLPGVGHDCRPCFCGRCRGVCLVCHSSSVDTREVTL